MPVWNGEAHLAEAIDSILAQTFRDFELLVIDDGSTDRTNEILSSYSDYRIHVHRLNHGGIVTALNYGVSVARADWIARQDADDVSRPERLEEQWTALKRVRNAAVCHTDVQLIGNRQQLGPKPHFARSDALLKLRLCFQCPIVHSTVLFQKAAFKAVGGYRPEERHAEDYALWGRMLDRGRFVGVSRKLLRFRLHESSVSRQNLELQRHLTAEIGREHCRRFMNLEDGAAVRAHAILSTEAHARSLREWLWFLRCCVPRLKAQSTELYAWLASQTGRLLLSRASGRHIHAAE